MSMYTPWNKDATPAIYIEYDGNSNALTPSNRLQYLEGVQCDHFVGTEGVGDVF